jgi:hypothetical protein
MPAPAEVPVDPAVTSSNNSTGGRATQPDEQTAGPFG